MLDWSRVSIPAQTKNALIFRDLEQARWAYALLVLGAGEVYGKYEYKEVKALVDREGNFTARDLMGLVYGSGASDLSYYAIMAEKVLRNLGLGP